MTRKEYCESGIRGNLIRIRNYERIIAGLRKEILEAREELFEIEVTEHLEDEDVAERD